VQVQLGTQNRSKTPVLTDITVTWVDSVTGTHSITYTLRNSSVTVNGSDYNAAFDSNNWASSDAIKVKASTTNIEMTPASGTAVDASLQISKGQYNKKIDTYGDWKNNELNVETNNVYVHGDGYITLHN
jgi:hypothetical protein